MADRNVSKGIFDNTQLTFTCSKLTVETLEKGVKLCSKLTTTTLEPRQRRFGVVIVNFEHSFTPFSIDSIVKFEQINVGWVINETRNARAQRKSMKLILTLKLILN